MQKICSSVFHQTCVKTANPHIFTTTQKKKYLFHTGKIEKKKKKDKKKQQQKKKKKKKNTHTHKTFRDLEKAGLHH